MEHLKNQRYSEDFKLKIVKEVLSGELSNLEAKQKYRLGGNSDVSKWVKYYKEYGVCSLSLVQKPSFVKDKPLPNRPTKLQLEAQIKLLEQKLQDESLLREMYSRMIDIAEREYKISIRKKPGAK
jgi:transposase-like protein